MYHEPGTTIVQKRMSFFSVIALCISLVLITVIVSASGLAIYGLRIVDRKADSLAMLVGDTVKSLPEFQKALPPALADAIDDVRRPDYLSQLDVKSRLIKSEKARYGHYQRAVVEVTNQGDDVVSLLSLRIVGADADGETVMERCTWAATPIQVEDEWRGPLLPHETRKIPVRFYSSESIDTVSHEVTDIRTWKGPKTNEKVAIQTLP